MVEITTTRYGEPGGDAFPYEFTFGSQTCVVYHTSVANAVALFKRHWPTAHDYKVRLMADNE